jgi:Sec7-like guanine-nucleotide exchange factor
MTERREKVLKINKRLEEEEKMGKENPSIEAYVYALELNKNGNDLFNFNKGGRSVKPFKAIIERSNGTVKVYKTKVNGQKSAKIIPLTAKNIMLNICETKEEIYEEYDKDIKKAEELLKKEFERLNENMEHIILTAKEIVGL